jgi:hypothetical protein
MSKSNVFRAFWKFISPVFVDRDREGLSRTSSAFWVLFVIACKFWWKGKDVPYTMVDILQVLVIYWAVGKVIGVGGNWVKSKLSGNGNNQRNGEVITTDSV